MQSSSADNHPGKFLKSFKNLSLDTGLFVKSILVLLLTFPKVGVPVAGGLDPSYYLAYNWFFYNHPRMGSDILFTYGPLGFLNFAQPLGNNILAANLVLACLQFVFIYALLRFAGSLKNSGNLLGMALILIVCCISPLEFVICFTVGVSFLIYIEEESLVWVLVAATVCALACLIKSSYGILSLIISASSLSIILVGRRNFKPGVLFAAVSLGLFISIWFLLFRDLHGIPDFIRAWIEHSDGNSSAMTSNPVNDWWCLGISFSCFLVIPFLLRDRRISLLYLVFGLSIVAMWKYAFSREDAFHIDHFIGYLILFYLLALAVADKKKVWRAALAAGMILLSFTLFFKNMILTDCRLINLRVVGNVPDAMFRQCGGTIFGSTPGDRAGVFFRVLYKNFKEDNGPANLYKATLGHDDYKTALLKISSENMKDLMLERDVIEIIGKGTVDIYPWNFGYFYANGFNWKPRPTLQSYVSYTPWLDMHDEVSLAEGGPDFIIMELKRWGGEVGSIDNRYIFNDEPRTFLQIMRNYAAVYKNSQVIVFKRAQAEQLGTPYPLPGLKAVWNEWIAVPHVNDSIVRGRFAVERTLWGKLRRALYKEGEFFVEYKLSDGMVQKYRFVADNTISGLWINPLYLSLSDPVPQEVVAIRLANDGASFFKPELALSFEAIPLRKKLFDVSCRP